LGCLFEAFLGALFLDCNKIAVADEAGWFANAFSTGPGFQMAQVFLENVFETHVNWIDLIRNDDNYKNILQVKIQKEFKTTPTYIEIEPFSATNGYHMGVYICLGQPVHTANPLNAVAITSFAGFADVHAHMSRHGRVLVFLGEGSHKTKKVAEQQSCMMAIDRIAALTQPAKSR
jgi:dsRNA-specific ribonuclease